MLETVKKYLNSYPISFNEFYINYMLDMHDINLKLELEYFKKHNSLDILDLDKFLIKQLDEVMNL